MASDHRAHANAPRVYASTWTWQRSRVSVWSCVCRMREGGHHIISGTTGRGGVKGARGARKIPPPVVGHHRRSKGDVEDQGRRGRGGRSLTCHLVTSPLPCRDSFFKCIPRSLALGRQSIATVRTSWVRGLDNKRTIDKGRQTLREARGDVIEAVRERARIDGGVLSLKEWSRRRPCG